MFDTYWLQAYIDFVRCTVVPVPLPPRKAS